MIWAVPIVLGVAAAAGVAYAVTRKPAQRLPTIKASPSIRVGAKSIPIRPNRQPKPPTRAKKDPHVPDLGVFMQTHEPITVEYLGCEPFVWGMCVKEAMEDATAAGGAAAVSSLLEWIGNFTGLDVITEALCFRFEFNLHRFRDGDKYFWLIMDPLPIGRGGGVSSLETLRKYAPHPAPRSEKYVRAWRIKSDPGWFEDQDGAKTIYFPDDDKWSIAISTTDLRTLFRHDQIDVPELGDAQCKPGRWTFSSRQKAMNRYR